MPHIAFKVDDLDEALKDKEILIEPSSPSDGVRAAMIVHDGAPVELIEFHKDSLGENLARVSAHYVVDSD